MLKFKEYLTEIFDKFDKHYHFGAPYSTRDSFYYVFTTDDGRKVNVLFTTEDPDPSLYASTSWYLGFSVDKRIDITGKGDALKIFTTVIAIMKDFVAHEHLMVGEIVFTASNEGKKPDSRITLYRRMLKKFAQQENYTISEEPFDRGVEFHIFKR